MEMQNKLKEGKRNKTELIIKYHDKGTKSS